MARAVLDTSVLSTGMVTQGATASCCTAILFIPAHLGRNGLIAETWYILTLRAARAAIHPRVITQQSRAMLHQLLAVMEAVSIARGLGSSPPSPLHDHNDEAVWFTAVVANAHYVISHNTRHFPPLVREEVLLNNQPFTIQRHIHQGIEFLTAIEFIEEVLGEDAIKSSAQHSPPKARITAANAASSRITTIPTP